LEWKKKLPRKFIVIVIKKVKMEEVIKLKFKRCPPFEKEKHLNFTPQQARFFKKIENYCESSTEKQIEVLIDIIKPYYTRQSKESLGFPLKYNLLNVSTN
jgi:hypothetical protein